MTITTTSNIDPLIREVFLDFFTRFWPSFELFMAIGSYFRKCSCLVVKYTEL